MSNFIRDSSSSIRKDRAFYLMRLEVVAMQLICGPSKLPIRNMKPIFKTTPVISAFTGNDLVVNLMKELRAERKESIHVASQLYKHGYLYSVEQNVSTFKDDSTHYRMQSEHLWPSQCNNPNNLDYSAYLEKKMLMKYKLAEHEQEAYDRFRVIYSKNWYMLTKKALTFIDQEENTVKEDRSISQGEERAFWRLHRPPPGEPLVMEASIQKRNLNISDTTDFQAIQGLETKVDIYRRSIRRNGVKLSHSVELVIQYVDRVKNTDPFLKKSIHNPWINDSKTPPPVNPSRFEQWSTSFDLLLRDKLGRELFMKFLSSEVSSENLQFCEEVTKYKMLPSSHLRAVAPQIFFQYCGATAKREINIDGKTLRAVRERMAKPDRYTFDPAQNYIYDLMRKDPYYRFLKSKFFADPAKIYSMERKGRRDTRILPPPLNAESMHPYGNRNHDNPPDMHPLQRSNSMDALVESLVDPCKADLLSDTHHSINAESLRGKHAFQRNTSANNLLLNSTPNDIAQLDEVDERNVPFHETSKSNFERHYPHNNNSFDSKLSSFDEMSLTKPLSPRIKNLPRPKTSVSHLQLEETYVKKANS